MNNKFMQTVKSLFLISAIFIILVIQTQTSFAQTVDERIGRALAAINKDEFDAAMTDINEIFKTQPDNTTALYLRGIINYKKKNFDQAIADQTKAIQLNTNPKFVEFYYERGLAYQYKPTPDYKLALADFSHALQNVPNYRAAYVERGWANFRLKNWSVAADDYAQAIKYGENTAETYINSGAANLNAGNYAQAVADTQKGLALDPNNDIAKKNLEIALANQIFSGDPSIASLNVTELLKRADNAKKSGDSAAQEKYLTAAIKADVKNFEAYEQRAFLLKSIGKNDAALADVQMLINLDPANFDGYFIRADFYKDLKNYAQAIPDYTSLLNLKLDAGQTARIHYERAVAYHKIHEYDKAVADLGKALELQPDYKSALAERGELYTFQGNYELAETDLKKLLKLQPDSELGSEYTEIIKTARKNGFNTGKIKEDTLFKFDEYSDAVISAADVYTNKYNAITSVIVQNPKDSAKICGLIVDADTTLKNIEANVTQINQMLTAGKFDKLPALKTAAGQIVGLFPDNRQSLNQDTAKYGCKLN